METLRRSSSRFNPRPPCGGRQQKQPKNLTVFVKFRHLLQIPPPILPSFPNTSRFLHANYFKNPVRSSQEFLCTCASHLKHQDILRIISRLCAKMLDLILIAIPQIIKAQTVFFRIHDLAQSGLQTAALCRIQQAFKDGILNTLAEINTLLCDLPQAFASGSVLCVHVISN